MKESAKKKASSTSGQSRAITLAPLSFEEVVSDILKVKPEPKPPKKKPTVKKRAKA